MKLIIQRVSKASVSTDGKTISNIGRGLFVLIGMGQKDQKEDAEYLVEKLFKLRVMADESGKMNLTVKDVDGQILVVSQFTLYGDTSGGNRPSFIKAAHPSVAEPLYKHFVESLQNKGVSVKTGRFGEYMEIELVLDGPVTILLESPSLPDFQ